MKTLVIYYSLTGNNDALARKLSERLQCDLFRIEETSRRYKISILFDLIFKRQSKLKPCSLPIETYDHLVFVAPVWAGKIATPMQTFLLQQSQRINDYSWISICSGVQGQSQKIIDYLATILQKEPAVVDELWINDLLAPEQKDKIKYTTPYRVKESDWKVFNSRLASFVNAVSLHMAVRSDVTAH